MRYVWLGRRKPPFRRKDRSLDNPFWRDTLSLNHSLAGRTNFQAEILPFVMSNGTDVLRYSGCEYSCQRRPPFLQILSRRCELARRALTAS